VKGIGVVLQRNLKDFRQTKTFLVITGVVVAIIIGATVGICIWLSGWLKAGSDWEVTKSALELTMGLTVYFMTLIMMLSYTLTFDPITEEKTKRTIESLLATPLSAKAVWVGKSLALFLPGLIVGLASALIVVLAVNSAVILPRTEHFILPAPAAVVGFLLNPLVALLLALLISLISLIYNVQIATVIILLVLVGLCIGQGMVSPASWEFALYSLAGVTLIGTIVFFLSRLLIKEKVILSSKGR
jgi:ABC-type Na+ efflux pump permease subunit